MLFVLGAQVLLPAYQELNDLLSARGYVTVTRLGSPNFLRMPPCCPLPSYYNILTSSMGDPCACVISQ